MENKKHVFILGSKGIPANYGGFETFVEKLTENQINKSINYFVACQFSPKEYTGELFNHNNATCFPIRVPNIGAAKAIYYDWCSLKWTMNYIKENNINNAVVLMCACRIGPIIASNIDRIHKLGAKLIINPDGHEWKRAKWNIAIKKYWKFSEKLCVQFADYIVCDSINIEKYINEEYSKYRPRTTYIAYGADTSKTKLSSEDPRVVEWFNKWDLKPQGYYLNVARFVPENNYETIIREFMGANTEKSLVIVTDISGNKLYKGLRKKLRFESDERIKFVGSIYDQELIKKIRENAYGYIHGHSVGGTNPSLLEAMGTLDLNLLFDCKFNSEVGGNGAKYWSLDKGSLGNLIDMVDSMTYEEIKEIGAYAHSRIDNCYTWNKICAQYEAVFVVNSREYV